MISAMMPCQSPTKNPAGFAFGFLYLVGNPVEGERFRSEAEHRGQLAIGLDDSYSRAQNKYDLQYLSERCGAPVHPRVVCRRQEFIHHHFCPYRKLPLSCNSGWYVSRSLQRGQGSRRRKTFSGWAIWRLVTLCPVATLGWSKDSPNSPCLPDSLRRSPLASPLGSQPIYAPAKGC